MALPLRLLVPYAACCLSFYSGRIDLLMLCNPCNINCWWLARGVANAGWIWKRCHADAVVARSVTIDHAGWRWVGCHGLLDGKCLGCRILTGFCHRRLFIWGLGCLLRFGHPWLLVAGARREEQADTAAVWPEKMMTPLDPLDLRGAIGSTAESKRDEAASWKGMLAAAGGHSFSPLPIARCCPPSPWPETRKMEAAVIVVAVRSRSQWWRRVAVKINLESRPCCRLVEWLGSCQSAL